MLKYQWVKLPRNHIPAGKGIMGYWARLASRAAFRDGQANYCGYVNDVTVGTWSGGVVGLKSILGVKSRQTALEIMDALVHLGYIEYTLNPETKKLTYKILDYVVKCSGEPCLGPGAVYATDGYGFICLPRNITKRLADDGYTFDEADAWLDLWCHTVWQDQCNIFSNEAPAVQYGQYGAVLTLDTLGQRWGWEKTKVWRFLQKHKDDFILRKLPGSYGCLIFNQQYPVDGSFTIPENTEIMRILDETRFSGRNTHLEGTDNERINKLIAWHSPKTAKFSHSEETSGSLSITEDMIISGHNTHFDNLDSEISVQHPLDKYNPITEYTESVSIPDEKQITDMNTHNESIEHVPVEKCAAWNGQKQAQFVVSDMREDIMRIPKEKCIISQNTHIVVLDRWPKLQYPADITAIVPEYAGISHIMSDTRIMDEIRIVDQGMSVVSYSNTVSRFENRVAVSGHITRAYLSLSNCTLCNYDCGKTVGRVLPIFAISIRDP